MKEDFAARIARIEAKRGQTQPLLDGPLPDAGAGRIMEPAPVGNGRRVLLFGALLLGLPVLAIAGMLVFAQMGLM